MRWHRLAAIARKESIQVRRDIRSLMIVFLMPVMLMAQLGYGINLDQKHVTLCVFDREGSQRSQDLLKRFQNTEYFKLKRNYGSYSDLIGAIDRGSCRLGLVIPNDFSEHLRAGGSVAVQGIVDGTDDNSANVIFSYGQLIIQKFSSEVQLDWIRQRGGNTSNPPVSVDARTWFNEDLESRNFIVPGVIAIVMAVIGTLLTSLTIAREWERGTMEQLISTPVTPLELLLGKLAPYFAIGLLDTAFCAGICVWWFGVPFRGTLFALFLASALFLSGVLATGFWISALTKNQLAASQFSLLATFLPAFLLSGFAFPVDQMPVAIQSFTYLISARYYVAILKSVFLKGTGPITLRAPMLGLALFATIVGTLALRALRKNLD
ncbi:MAG TPA: ABC transporter permease [Candidatus Binataceae bacterium]|jgi:ABC-2 type transport system permease protein